MVRKYVKGRRPFRKGARKPRKRMARAKGLFKKKVLSVIHEQVEDKKGFASQTTTNYNGVIDSNTEFYSIVPSIAQGTDTNSRVGNQIRGKNCIVRGHLAMNLTSDTDSNSRIIVRLMCVTNKLAPSHYSTADNTGLDRLLENHGSAQKFNGDVLSLYLPVNRELFTVHYDRLHVLTIDQLYHSNATDIELTRSTRYTTKLFQFRIPCRKLMRFGDGLAYPSNFFPRICMGYAHVDGSSADSVETQVQMTWISELTFEDA